MNELAPGVFQLALTPRNGINAYLLGDVLVDAGIKQHGGKVLKALQGRTVAAHAVTHAHPDHAGASKRVTEELGIPYWVGERDAPAAADGQTVAAKSWMAPFGRFPGRPVDRQLLEGDEVAGFTVLDTPGHSPGHVSFWRESDRVLICGDVVNTMNLVTTAAGLREPPGPFTPDPERNRVSIRRLAELRPALLCAGHGPPVRDADRLQAFADEL